MTSMEPMPPELAQCGQRRAAFLHLQVMVVKKKLTTD